MCQYQSFHLNWILFSTQSIKLKQVFKVNVNFVCIFNRI
jgi:hypothetical protein